MRPTIVGYEPQDHQIKFHQSQRKGRAFIGGNRSGKTVGGAAEMVMHVTGKHLYWEKFQRPIRARVVAVDFDNGVDKIVIPEIARWLPPSSLKNGSWEDSYQKSNHTLTLADDSFIEFMSYDQDTDKFAGTSRHYIWFDEEPPRAIFDECMLRLADTGGHWWLTMTPIEEMTWTYDGIYLPGKDGTNPNIEVFEVSSIDNKYISSVELEALTSGMSEEDKAARMHGTYIRHSGNIYSKYLHPDTILKEDVLRTDAWPAMKAGWLHFRMMDHGFTNPTVFLWGAADHEGRVIIYDEYYETKRLVGENAKAVRERTQVLGVDIAYTVGDPSIQNTDPVTGTSVHVEYARNGIPIILGTNDVHSGILRVGAAFLNRKLFISPRCEKTIWELNRYRWGKFVNKKVAELNNQKEMPVKKDDHAMDALKYGIASRPELAIELAQPVGNVLNASKVLMNDERIDALAGVQRTSEYFDYTLGSDW